MLGVLRRRDRSLPPPNVLKYYLYKATEAVEFYRPIMYLFFLAQGLTFTQIAILEAIYNLTTVLGEIPTGFEQERVCRLPERAVEFSRGGRVGTQLTSEQG
jgi:hypothetical protein